MNQTQSGNPLNVDPPQSLGDFVSSLNDSVNQYAQLVETYLEQANQTMAANLIGDSVINAVSLQKNKRGESKISCKTVALQPQLLVLTKAQYVCMKNGRLL